MPGLDTPDGFTSMKLDMEMFFTCLYRCDDHNQVGGGVKDTLMAFSIGNSPVVSLILLLLLLIRNIIQLHNNLSSGGFCL